MNAKSKVIIDCDPGIDDSLALMLAITSKEMHILGITVVCGNVPVETGAENVLKILKLMDRLDIPVYIGEAKPIVREYVSAQDTHGVDGLGGSNYPSVEISEKNDPRGGIKREGAVEFIVKALKEYPDTSIVALGPLTNLARAIELDEEVFTNLKECVSMGGNYRSFGNCSPVAEYNYWCDPHAAKTVYKNFSKIGKKIHMVGLDVTRKIVLTPNILEYMKRLNPILGGFVEDITRFYFEFHWKQEKIIGCVINDPLAIAYFINKKICSGFSAYTDIETMGITAGQSVVDSQGFYGFSPNSIILTEVDSFEFMKMFLIDVFLGEEEEVTFYLKEIGGRLL
ncbi:nucleoside hydrolase [Anaerocolumna cellulosilytica]|uniref:Nucleoside hydrolase n=1 Tax=Anaerocolumna cellulosilytica TaxID=433286 RepID=A0A6S6R4Q7_9FIRM|nr:nucleoside hydrolase [Anaerocolumna cellulosilytica]MBB5197241.1 purine nucleosidase [Anaerocolumna cellulosilytica]BCJ94048.1 nucleoside hydrolase [Anaerocolumna cellulosilytica]